MPFCTGDDRRRVRCVVGSTRVHFLFMNRRRRCSGTRHVFTLYPSLRHVVVFSSDIHVDARSPTTLCFGSFLGLNRGLPHRARIRRLCGRTGVSSLTSVLCADKAANSDGNMVLACDRCTTTLGTGGRYIPIASGSQIVSFLPFARVFRHT